MNGLPYKETFAAKGSELYRALTEGPEGERATNAKKVYTFTTARSKATLLGVPPPKQVVDEKGKTTIVWHDGSVYK
jgi:hypothetical protein